MTDEERSKFREKYGIKPEEELGYVMGEEKDYEILAEVKLLELKFLSEEDKELVALIRTQLADDWRDPLIEKLSELENKYGK